VLGQLEKGLLASNGAAENKSVDVVGSLVSVDGLKVHTVSDDVVFVTDAVSTESVPHLAGDVECFTTRVAFHQRDHLRSDFLIIDESSHTYARLQAN